MAQPSISNIVKKRAVVESEIKLHSSNLQSKKICQKTKYPEVNQVVLEFFKKCSDKNIPISGPLLQAKAKLVAERLGFSEFQASNGWLESFHQRNCINNKILSGEAADANVGLADQWKSQIPDITAGFLPKDIFNCDEFALFFRMMPTRPRAKSE